MTSRYLVLGKNGQLGRCLTRTLDARAGCELVAALGRDEVDLADAASLARLPEGDLGSADPWLLNAAAYTAVDQCESDVDVCHAVNGDAPGALADWCRERNVGFVHVSTDYVFAGDAETPYREDDPTAPRTEYGRSKLAGEVAVLERTPAAWIVRTSWVFGPGKNFVGAIVRQGVLREAGKAEGPLRVVADQIGCPTYAGDLAEAIVTLTQCNQAGAGGLLHLSNSEACTWWDFARAILDAAGYGHVEIDRVSTDAFPTPAPRPAYSVLDTTKARGLGIEMRPWREALEDYLAGDDFSALHQSLRDEVAVAG
ncbi:MAG: dTDP-4-dehydrorhamnose reductase [Myxococcota bacterium]|jgi:dTDP-4-dehydrorhamnose reductase|nr:dTDP-4-dehydrorhamnose reductase [Myxococcota bacterium]